MKKTSVRQYAAALYEATQSCADESGIKLVVEKFAAILARERQLKKSGRIIGEFLNITKERAGILSVEITSARELDKKTVASIERVFGKKIEPVCRLDPSLMGGFVLRTKERILDASVKTQLKKLKQSLA